MRPISAVATALNNFLDFLWYLLWFGGWIGATYWAEEERFHISLPVPFSWILIGIAAGLFVAYVLRPLRKLGYMFLARELARSSSRTLMEVGVWRLLRVAYRFWPQEPVTDYIGMAAVHRVYDQSGAKSQEQLYAVIRQMESSPGCPVAQAAHDFLDHMGLEEDRAAPSPPTASYW